MTGPPRGARSAKSQKAPNTLGALLDRSDGRLREQAIAQASKNIEELRGSSMEALEEIVSELEAMIANGAQPDEDRVRKVQRLADRAITLAGTYGLTAMADTGRRLCDLTMLADQNTVPDEALAVCIRAMRLFSPGAKQPDQQSTDNVLQELRAIVAHFGNLAVKSGG